MFPGGPGIPSAPLRPGRPGGPCERTEEESYGEHQHVVDLATLTANRGQSSPAPRVLPEVPLVLWLRRVLALPAHTDQKHVKSEFDGILFIITNIIASFHSHIKIHCSCMCVCLSHVQNRFLTWTLKKNVLHVSCHAAKITNLRSWRPVWSCNLCALQKFHRNLLFGLLLDEYRMFEAITNIWEFNRPNKIVWLGYVLSGDNYRLY